MGQKLQSAPKSGYCAGAPLFSGSGLGMKRGWPPLLLGRIEGEVRRVEAAGKMRRTSLRIAVVYVRELIRCGSVLRREAMVGGWRSEPKVVRSSVSKRECTVGWWWRRYRV